MKLRNIIALLLVLCMAFTLVACGETDSKKSDNDDEEIVGEGDKAEKGDKDEEPVDNEDTKPQVGEYIVYVEDEDGQPVAGVALNFNRDTGDTTIITDEDGRARLQCLVTDIVVTVKEVPEDYEEDDEEYAFDDEFEITITLDFA